MAEMSQMATSPVLASLAIGSVEEGPVKSVATLAVMDAQRGINPRTGRGETTNE